MNQAHEQIADAGPILRLVEQRVLTMQDGSLQGSFTNIVIERRPGLSQDGHRLEQEHLRGVRQQRWHGPQSQLDVFLTKSTDGGAHWSPPLRVSSTSTGQQYNPAISIDSGGAINVSYLDRRQDTTNNCRTNTYLSRSTDGGANFTDSRVTDADSSFNGNGNGPGDYSGIASLGSSVHPYFADHRDANISLEGGTAGAFEIYTAIKP